MAANCKGRYLLDNFLLIVILLIVFYLLGFFLSFQIGDFKGISIAFLCVYIMVTFFSLCTLMVSFGSPFSKANLLQSLSFLAVLLSALTIITAAGTDAFKIVNLIVLPAFAFHLFILVVAAMQFIKVKSSFKRQQKQAKKLTPAEENKRIHKRFKHYVAAQYSLPGQPWKKIEVYDVSASGVRLILIEELKVGQQLSLKFSLPQDSRLIFAEGLVMWKKRILEKKVFHLGIRFSNIDPADKLRLTLRQVYSLFTGEM